MGFKNKLALLKEQWSLLVGLGVTGDKLYRPTITVHYPRAQVDNLSSFRGPIQLVGSDKDPKKPRCIACMMCMNTCPSGCLTVVKKKAPKPTAQQLQAEADAVAKGQKVKKAAAPKEPETFTYDFSLCSLCGLCTEVCPVDSLAFSNDVYLVTRDRSSLVMDLLAKLQLVRNS